MSINQHTVKWMASVALEYKFNNDGIGLLITGKGCVSGKDFLDVLDNIYAATDDVIKLKYTILDFSSLSEMDVSFKDIEQMVFRHKHAARISPDRIISLIVKNDCHYGVSRMWTALTNSLPWESWIFRSEREANLWLKETLKHKFNIDM